MPEATRPLRLGLIGYGAIGREVVAAARRGALGDRIAVAAVLTRRPREAEPGLAIVQDRGRFLAEGPDVVLEGAGHAAVREHGEACLAAGADLLLTSIGALTDDALHARLEAAAQRAGRRLILASAGIGALDILAGAAVGGLDAVTVTVRKDPSAWYGTIAEHQLDLATLAAPAVLHDGSVREGARLYPQNVNIAAAAALAGLGLDRTRLVILADPGITDHVVEIEARGWFGSFSFREAIVPTVDNPKTGRLVALAVVKTVRQLASPVVVGW
jgi:aspartate dehydrogenase